MSVALATLGWHLNLLYTVQKTRCHCVTLEHLLRSTGEYNLTTLATGLWAEVNEIVSRKHYIAVVLHHNDGVTDVAQALERVNKPVVVTWMEADTRLIKDVEHIDKLRTHLGRKTYALSLTARE